MGSGIKEQIKNEYNLYKGVEELIKSMEGKDIMKETTVQIQLNRILQNKKNLENFITKNKGLSEKELEKKWAERATGNSQSMSPEERKQMRDFFSGMDSKIAKTEAYKNLYELYLKNNVAGKNPSVERWEKKKTELDKKLTKIIKENPSIDVHKIDTYVSASKNQVEKLKTNLEKLPEQKEIDKINKKYSGSSRTNKRYKLDVSSRFSNDTEKIREEINDKLGLLYTVQGALEDCVKYLNEYERDIKRDEAHTTLYDKNQKERDKKKAELDRKEMAALNEAYTKIDNAWAANNKLYEKAYHISDLQSELEHRLGIGFLDEHANDLEYREQPIGMFWAGSQNPTPPSWSVHKNDVYRSVREIVNSTEFKEAFGYKHLKEDDIAFLTIGEIEQRMIEVDKKQWDAVKESIDNLPDRYALDEEKILDTKDIRETRAKFEELDNWLDENYSKRTSIDDIQEMKKSRNYILEQSRADIEELFKYTNFLRNPVDEIFEVKKYEKILSGDQIMEKLSKFEARLEEQLSIVDEIEKDVNRINELKEQLKDLSEGKKLEEERKNLKGLESIKKQIDELKREKEKMSDIVNEQSLEDKIKEEAAALLEEMDMNKGNHKNSKEYNAMIAALKIVEGWGTDKVNENLTKIPEKERPQNFRQALDYVKKKSEKYIEAKDRQVRLSPSELRRTRYAYSRAIVGFAERRSQEMDILSPQKSQAVEKARTEIREKTNEQPTISI